MQIESVRSAISSLRFNPRCYLLSKQQRSLSCSAARKAVPQWLLSKAALFQNDRPCHNDVGRVWVARARVHSARILFSSLAFPPPAPFRTSTPPRLIRFHPVRRVTQHTCPVKTVNDSDQANLLQVNGVRTRPGRQLPNIDIRLPVGARVI